MLKMLCYRSHLKIIRHFLRERMLFVALTVLAVLRVSLRGRRGSNNFTLIYCCHTSQFCHTIGTVEKSERNLREIWEKSERNLRAQK